ncbi:hypothetical protein K466DRAFT_542333 [Polyporus arcularius HHB13444]|uniref:Thioesterase domain-containing protein n=2 Tax=Polyporaceae TaxID=5317 RepID=A0A5C3PTA1_9APHY|nr:hypothetical protein OH76DRAFT_1403355 [Polyporus brumalis]TFK91058.1 hypothetical protein K466DRAFT_542333 [Polyporus arcularius HHB13444]
MSPSPSLDSQDLRARSTTRFSDNLTSKQREEIVDFAEIILRGRGEFAKPTGSRLELCEVLTYERPEDGKMHAEVVFEIDMAEDMLNSARHMHGGCAMFMVDVCSSIALVALSIAMNKRVFLVSQSLTTVFHSPALLGARLRITNKTTAFGARTVSARTEIWDVTNRRLIATGIHNQMPPSQPKL